VGEEPERRGREKMQNGRNPYRGNIGEKASAGGCRRRRGKAERTGEGSWENITPRMGFRQKREEKRGERMRRKAREGGKRARLLGRIEETSGKIGVKQRSDLLCGMSGQIERSWGSRAKT